MEEINLTGWDIETLKLGLKLVKQEIGSDRTVTISIIDEAVRRLEQQETEILAKDDEIAYLGYGKNKKQ